jgi:hypothetical protein
MLPLDNADNGSQSDRGICDEEGMPCRLSPVAVRCDKYKNDGRQDDKAKHETPPADRAGVRSGPRSIQRLIHSNYGYKNGPFVY